ncbi:hypothetical protein K492DRAFT_176643 [Lichtheimia hyalospora FSU 10163]|nr:hypothetical protein K492DRAFT_176643 [Lichtheimia hyalospora FSU 10163]
MDYVYWTMDTHGRNKALISNKGIVHCLVAAAEGQFQEDPVGSGKECSCAIWQRIWKASAWLYYIGCMSRMSLYHSVLPKGRV